MFDLICSNKIVGGKSERKETYGDVGVHGHVQ